MKYIINHHEYDHARKRGHKSGDIKNCFYLYYCSDRFSFFLCCIFKFFFLLLCQKSLQNKASFDYYNFRITATYGENFVQIINENCKKHNLFLSFLFFFFSCYSFSFQSFQSLLKIQRFERPNLNFLFLNWVKSTEFYIYIY